MIEQKITNFVCHQSFWVSFNSLPLITLITTKRHAFRGRIWIFWSSCGRFGGRNFENHARPSVFFLLNVKELHQVIDVGWRILGRWILKMGCTQNKCIQSLPKLQKFQQPNHQSTKMCFCSSQVSVADYVSAPKKCCKWQLVYIMHESTKNINISYIDIDMANNNIPRMFYCRCSMVPI